MFKYMIVKCVKIVKNKWIREKKIYGRLKGVAGVFFIEHFIAIYIYIKLLYILI